MGNPHPQRCGGLHVHVFGAGTDRLDEPQGRKLQGLPGTRPPAVTTTSGGSEPEGTWLSRKRTWWAGSSTARRSAKVRYSGVRPIKRCA
ncbi:hypothetical protein STIAU_0432, partial [Stigmatella aurantiaca DW4/3-1]